MLALYGSEIGVNMVRKHIGWYTKGLPGSAEFRNTRQPGARSRSSSRRCSPNSTRHGSPAPRLDPARPRGARRRRRRAPASCSPRCRRRRCWSIAAGPRRAMPMPPAEALLNLAAATIVGRPIDALIAHRRRRRRADAATATRRSPLTTSSCRCRSERRLRVDLLVGAAARSSGLAGDHDPAPRRRLAGRPLARIAPAARCAAVGAAAMLAHEIKNPLSGIRGAAQLLEATGDDGRRALTRLIRDEVDRIAALIDRMEGFTDPRPLELEPAEHPRHARPCRERRARRALRAASAIRESLRSVAAAGARPSRCAGPGLPQPAQECRRGARSPRRRARSTLDHRLSPRPVGRAAPTAARARRLPIEMCVIDDGPGAPAEIADHLFDPFVTVEADGQRPRPRAGRQAGRRSWAASSNMPARAQPARTVFRILLPRTRARHDRRPAGSSSSTTTPRSAPSSREALRRAAIRSRPPAPPPRCSARSTQLRAAGAGHRRHAARRQRPRPGARACSPSRSGPAGDRAVGAEHADHGGARDRAGGVRLSPQAVRSRRADPRGRRRAGAAAVAGEPPTMRRSARTCR